MIRKRLKHILTRRHFWRDAGFDELTELYISSMLRTFALSLLMVFVPFYLYQHGYSVTSIFLFYGYYFAAKAACDILASYFIARYGPKHSMIVSCCLQIVSASMFMTLTDVHWPLALVGGCMGAAASFYFIAYHVEFSKIKHTSHSGKELGHMQMYEKVAAIAGPLVGGVAGSYFGSRYIFMVAAITLFASLVPLFQTAETIRTRQQLRFADFPLARARYDYLSYVALGVENTLCINLMPLFLALFALGGSVYAQLGGLTSVSILASVLAAQAIGRYVDTKDARKLLRLAASLNAVIYTIRPFVGSLFPALLVNTANEVVTTGYRIPYLKGMYAAADDLPGFRIVYIGSMECIGSITKGTAWLMLAAISTIVGTRSSILAGFMIAALASVVIMTERYRSLDSLKRSKA